MTIHEKISKETTEIGPIKYSVRYAIAPMDEWYYMASWRLYIEVFRHAFNMPVADIRTQRFQSQAITLKELTQSFVDDAIKRCVDWCKANEMTDRIDGIPNVRTIPSVPGTGGSPD